MNIEQEIHAKGLTAPRITPEDIEAAIAAEHYFTAGQGAYGNGQYPGDISEPLHLLTFCVLVLKNGYTVTGESACLSPENFDTELGRKIARRNAVAKVWPLMGFLLRDGLSMTAAARDVLAERLRQVEAEGWTPEHDDQHGAHELAEAAACYALHAAGSGSEVARNWPWEPHWFKATCPRRDLVKAAALILAEIERLDRAAAKEAA